MKIFIDDGFALKHGGGIANYTKMLYTGLRDRRYTADLAEYKYLGRIQNVVLRRFLYSIYLNFLLPLHLKRNRYNIAHFTNFQIPLIKNNFTKYVTTIHDLNNYLFPEIAPLHYRAYFKIIVREAIRNSTTIITVSKAVKKDLRSLFGVPKGKIRVCYNGAKRVEFRQSYLGSTLRKYQLESKAYFLFVGRLERRKNLVTLIRAFDTFKSKTKSVKKLVLVGGQGYGSKEITYAIDSLSVAKDIILPGFLTDEELNEIYSNALAFVFPSLCEGFGLPLLEAMQYKLPIILSNIPTNSEIMDERGFFFDVRSVDSLRNILERFENEPIPLIEYSDILKTYSLTNMIESHISVYNHVIA